MVQAHTCRLAPLVQQPHIWWSALANAVAVEANQHVSDSARVPDVHRVRGIRERERGERERQREEEGSEPENIERKVDRMVWVVRQVVVICQDNIARMLGAAHHAAASM